ncbi:MAG: Fur family transcriptional regulator [Acidimicrobiia bacterium]|nr:Fur family transcriptional regulator [Acidimicrobiia bacterium]
MHITSEALLDALRNQGLRITAARRAVCSIIAERHSEHLTAASILDAVQANPDAAADQSTVYRTLDALESSGLLVHSHLGHGAAVYHLASEAAHQHIVCSRCGATAAVPAGGLSEWLDDLRRHTGFEVDPTHFAVTGLCPNCAR